jgi:hypothetical protein
MTISASLVGDFSGGQFRCRNNDSWERPTCRAKLPRLPIAPSGNGLTRLAIRASGVTIG